jgi:hypothetical protein
MGGGGKANLNLKCLKSSDVDIDWPLCHLLPLTGFFSLDDFSKHSLILEK